MNSLPAQAPTVRSVDLHRESARSRLTFAVFVVSSSRYELKSRGEAFVDESGDVAVSLIESAGHVVVRRDILPDSVPEIGEALRAAAGSADVVLFIGGTGPHPRDVTVEAVRPAFSKELPGFGELFRMLSYEQVGPAAFLSRATAGVVEGSVVFCLPGSPDGIRLALERLILPEAEHAVWVARGYRHAHGSGRQDDPGG